MADWFDLEEFLHEAAYDPRRFVRTIAFARQTELPAVVRALEMVENPAVKIFGFAALAKRNPKEREVCLGRAAAHAEALQDPVARAGVLLALIDVISEADAAYFAGLLSNEIATLSDHDRMRYEVLFEKRTPRAAVEKDLIEKIAPSRIEMDLGLDDITASIARAMERAETRHVNGIRQLGRKFGTPAKPRVRLDEIGYSLGIDPKTFEIVAPAARPTETAASPGGVEATRRPERIVSTGFANDRGEPVTIVAKPSSVHHYFIEIGARVEGAVETGEVIPEDLSGAIDVVIYTNGDGLELRGPSRGRFAIEGDGTIRVSLPASVTDIDAAPELLERRMFFTFSTPPVVTTCSMRCSFYSRGLLIQSRNIVIPVGTGKPPTVIADYVLSRTLSPSYLAKAEVPLLSMMLNENVNGTHSFRFYSGKQPFTNSSTWAGGELESHIRRARAALRKAAWGTKEEWTPKDGYRFSKPRTIATVLPDLIDLARQGRVLWTATIGKLAGGPDAADALQQLMIARGDVQLALKETANIVLPLALFYDHEFDSAIPREQMKLCPQFISSLGQDSLAEEPCFTGGCPNREAKEIVCPGGFWGFRHAIGLPPSIGAQQSSPPELPPYITSGNPSFFVGVSTDEAMSSRLRHIPRLQRVAPQQVFDDRDAALTAMATTTAPIIYFYCHGGLDAEEGPFILIGPKTGKWIAAVHVYPIRWTSMRPIVFINGCHTVKVSPDEALDLVNPLVSRSGASGVIGTEITVFESLATTFAEAFFKEFVVRNRPAGEAIRRARLHLLQQTLNPLGLVYIPFVLPALSLRPPTGTPPS